MMKIALTSYDSNFRYLLVIFIEFFQKWPNFLKKVQHPFSNFSTKFKSKKFICEKGLKEQ